MRSPYAVRRPVENVYLVRERDRRLVRELLIVAATVLLLGGGLLTYTWIHIEITNIGYRVNRLEKELHGLQQAERRLGLEVTRLSHPGLVGERAAESLDMRPPTIEQTLFYEDLSP
ncbi:MAG: hypothetical protein AAGN66_19085 [Acidobacteriota bacterium]